MNFAEFMLLICCALGVIALIIVAIDEPRYTWREVRTFDDRMADIQGSFEAFNRAIGEALIPALNKAASSVNEFAKALESLGSVGDDLSDL